MSASFDLDAPDHFTVGTVGAPGERVFYIQGRRDRRLVTLKSEKEQVRVLATYLAQMLDKLPTASEPTPQNVDLVEPVDAAWPVASLGLGWDEDRQRIVIVAESVVEEEGEEPATARFAITRAPCTSPSAASAGCGISRRGSSDASWPRIISRRRSTGDWFRSPFDVTAPMARAHCRSSCTRTSASTTSRSARRRSTASGSRAFAPSISSPTTPTARAATACSAPTAASGPSTIASASTSSPSCAR